MSRFEGPQGIVTNGLVLNLDAGDPDSYTRSQPPYVEVLVVAGGGSGGSRDAGGGGAGGLIYNSAYQLTSAAAVTVTIGAGGASVGSGNHDPGNQGSNSVFGSLTAIGGGAGGAYSNVGGNGGSGGGAGGNTGTPGNGTSGQGNNGGGNGGTAYTGGGGGGAGAIGGTVSSNEYGGAGGNGLAFSISGTSTSYAGGGGGGGANAGGAGGTGGGGAGSTGGAGTSGTSNTGGGGGAARNSGSPSGAGGSGIVIVRYPGLPAATGGTITYLNGYTIHTFTSSGTFTPYKWNDLTGTAYSASLINGPSFNSFQNGGYIAFDGVDDYATTFTTPPSLQGDPNFTVCAWMRRTGVAGGNTGTWGLSGNGDGINSWWYNNANEIAIDTWGTSTFTTGVTYPLNEWVFVAWQKIAGDMTRANCILWRNLVRDRKSVV